MAGGAQDGRGTNEAEIAAVTAVVRSYYDEMVAGNAAVLARAFDPRASIVGNEEGDVYSQSVEELAAEAREAASKAGPGEWRIEDLAFDGADPPPDWGHPRALSLAAGRMLDCTQMTPDDRWLGYRERFF